jgi:predicted RNase H-like nuclease (RuvC/YqgF family)
MRIVLKIGLVLLATLTASAGAYAQSDTDRLREALRAATAQARALEDQRTALQAKVATAERDAAELKKQIDAAKAETRQIEKQHREAVEEFNQRLAQRDETLEKWKSAYEEAATVARSKDAERAKFEGEATAFKASTKSCQAKNVQLVKVGRELLRRYEGVSFGDMVVTSEPLIGIRRVEIQNLLQDYGDKILDQKVTR